MVSHRLSRAWRIRRSGQASRLYSTSASIRSDQTAGAKRHAIRSPAPLASSASPDSICLITQPADERRAPERLQSCSDSHAKSGMLRYTFCLKDGTLFAWRSSSRSYR